MNQTIDNTNVLVNDGCSGTVIDVAQRYVLTAAHCVEDQYETVEREKIDADGVVTKDKVRRLKDGTVSRFVFDGGTSTIQSTYRVRLKAVDKASDLALLQVIAPLSITEAAKFSCTLPQRGEQVYIVGNPMGSLYSSVTIGIVSSLQRDYALLTLDDMKLDNAKQPLMQISGGVIGGNSGGSTYNNSGELIGVPVLGHRTNETLGFAVPLDVIKRFLSANGVEAFEHCKEKN
jgi:S1-C subfamily serine protease